MCGHCKPIILNVFALDKYITTAYSCCLKVHQRDSSLPFPSSFNSSQIYNCLRSDTGEFQTGYDFLEECVNKISKDERLPDLVLVQWMMNIKSHLSISQHLFSEGFDHYATQTMNQDTLERKNGGDNPNTFDDQYRHDSDPKSANIEEQEDITFVSYLDILKERRKQRVKSFPEDEYEWTEEPLHEEDLDEVDLACVYHHLGTPSIQKQLNRFTCAECRPAYFYTRQADGDISIPVGLLRPSLITYLKDSGNLFYGTEELYEHFIELECIFRQYVDKSIQFKNPRKELLKILELPAYNVAEETSLAFKLLLRYTDVLVTRICFSGALQIAIFDSVFIANFVL
ncbi:hypothetical protein RvY_04990 [Ramazzottius varieornatus]|uniref:Uncharacterized protein n=1 Tax=Ramazzottius varieornatus TaxID=947166 RepID=A0A1D1V070_RAMVA|nr:hypothetical protein RvY_04990 [Ramazzottius varieornatus]